ncbi:hypothetical protein FE394_00125 [Xenorhabdus sp. Reich]|uniref:Uncharacterized protein n=1 Tax=Xenorhabdus littoralis TaxID=2582835 RepID=A0ABU4SG78_9GAMM|nr:hypothetical protein [Xenorhabdus sp. Reich]MDX7997642.1 hypothetical protein [Xenorhabdus sp. Reich]
MLKVTLLLFSGRDNYSWSSDSHSMITNKFLSLFQDNIRGLNIHEHEGKLGFSGFFVEFTDDTEAIAYEYGLPNSFYICDGKAPSLVLSQQLGLELLKNFNMDSEAEKIITDDIYNVKQEPYDISDDLTRDENEYIESNNRRRHLHDVGSKGNVDTDFINPLTGVSYSIEAGFFSKIFWNAPIRQPYNNCYSYACNYASNTLPQPGLYSNQRFKNNMQSVIDGIIADGLIPLEDYKNKDYPPNYVVALYTTETYPEPLSHFILWDYHFYRLCVSRGHEHRQIWGHKPGTSKARKRDEQNQIILDPNKCDRGNYTEFGGYFIVNRQVKIK